MAEEMTVGGFDASGRFRPRHQFGVERPHEQWLDTTAPPRYRIDENPNLIDRWMKTVGRFPD